MTEMYQIILQEELDDQWADWFVGLTVSQNSEGETVLLVSIVDQAELHGLLTRVRDLGLTLISVNRVRTDGEPPT